MLLIINKILMMILIMSILNIIRHIFFIIQTFLKVDGRYTITTTNLILLGLSISYIVSAIILGTTI